MIAAGKVTCFNCMGKRLNDNLNPFTLKKLEVWRKSNNPKSKSKGKLIAFAWVCTACEADGHNKVPFQSFNGEIRYTNDKLPPKMLEFLKEQKEKAEEKIKEEPVHPLKK